MYFPSLTDDELLRYAGTQELTSLEKELADRFESLREVSAGRNAALEHANVEVQALREEIESLKALA